MRKLKMEKWDDSAILQKCMDEVSSFQNAFDCPDRREQLDLNSASAVVWTTPERGTRLEPPVSTIVHTSNDPNTISFGSS